MCVTPKLPICPSSDLSLLVTLALFLMPVRKLTHQEGSNASQQTQSMKTRGWTSVGRGGGEHAHGHYYSYFRLKPKVIHHQVEVLEQIFFFFPSFSTKLWHLWDNVCEMCKSIFNISHKYKIYFYVSCRWKVIHSLHTQGTFVCGGEWSRGGPSVYTRQIILHFGYHHFMI